MDGLLPKNLNIEKPEEVRKARILVGFLFVIMFVTTMGTLFREQPLHHPITLVTMTVGVLFVGLYFLFRATGNIPLVTILFGIIMSGGVVTASYFSGGLRSDIFYWNTFIVIVSMFLMGSRWTSLLIAIVVIEIATFALLDANGHAFPVTIDQSKTFTFISRTSLFFLAGILIGWMYDSARLRAEEAKEKILEDKKKAEMAQHAAEMASQAKSDFLATMSHELRTPLNAIIGYSEMLLEEAEDYGAEEMEPDLEKICLAGKHLLALINDILDFSKIEAGKMTVHPELFTMAELCMEIEQTVQPLTLQNQNQFRLKNTVPDVELLTDRVKIRQCLLNLMSNANKFTQEGEVTLEASTAVVDDAKHAVFRVTDNGIGMTSEQVNNLFKKFTQADSSTSRRYGGTGLGLAITKRLALLLGGDIEVESEEGRGTTFTLHIPLMVQGDVAVLQPTQSTDYTPHSLPSPTSPDNRTVLVIDDDPTVLDMMTRFLTKEGFQVVSSSSGEEGLRIAEKILPFAITLDVMMQGMDGWTVLGKLKENPELAETPVIMVTIVDDFQKGYALGASEFLTKPFDREAILATLQKYQPKQKPWDVVIVEDDTNSRDLLVTIMEKAGWNTREAENGLLALEALQEKTPDLILLDLMMPEMDGFEFLEEMRKEEAFRHIPTIIITAKEITPEDRQRLSGYLQNILAKGGFTKEQLFAEIRSLVSTSASSTNK
ncbi:MAG: response regulator [Deltaproteobacteria bacterium]|nr:MAG: response regulator [Deltaproteobacteria bacterium]